MNIRNIFCHLSMFCCIGGFSVCAANAQTPGSPPPAKIEDASWISGTWAGAAMGGKFEETWNSPSANSMLGMFKFFKDDKVVFYEILTIVEQDQSLLLRLKHFNPDLVGWEEKDKSVEFPLVSISSTEAKFDGLTFKRMGDDQMHITVVTKDKSGEREIKFVCKRTKPK